MYEKYIKRILDFVLALSALIVISPVLLIIAILVKCNLGSPVIFRQERVGKDERIFTMYKFRTMSDKTDANGELLSDEQRHTNFGDILRSTSLDELPELFNILKGDLAIVGPRPLLVSYLPYYTEEERIRHTVRGGLTQPEVMHGLVTPTWEEQFRFEIEYVKNVSFLTDMRIILATIAIVFKRVETDYGGTVRRPLNEEREKERSGSK